MPILLLIILLSGLGFGLVLPGFLFVAENIGASPAWAMTIIATYALGQFIATPVCGRLSDRYGRKPVLVITTAGAVLAYTLLAFAENLWLLAFARLMTGLMAGNLSVAMAYVTDVSTPEKRAASMGYIGAAISLGFIVGPALGGILGGADAASASLMLPGLVAAGISAVTSLATLLFLKESHTSERRADALARAGAAGPGGIRALAALLRRPVLGRLMAVGLLVYFAMAMFETAFPLWANARFDWGPREVGLSFTYLGLLVAFVQGFLVGRLVPRFGEVRLVQAGLTSYACGLLMMTQAPAWPLMMIGITFTTAGGGMYVTTMTSLVSKQAGQDERGLVIGAYQSLGWFGRTIGPPVAGLLFGLFTPNMPLYAGALILVPALLLLALTMRPAPGRPG